MTFQDAARASMQSEEKPMVSFAILAFAGMVALALPTLQTLRGPGPGPIDLGLHSDGEQGFKSAEDAEETVARLMVVVDDTVFHLLQAGNACEVSKGPCCVSRRCGDQQGPKNIGV